MSLNYIQDEFISAATYELRTPLTSICTLSRILHDNPNLEVSQREKFLDVIVQESERLTEVVEEVLEWAELELGGVEWHLAEVDMKAVVEEVVQSIRKRPETKRVHLQVRFPAQLPPVIADRERVMEVMFSLLSNAINFCDDSSGWVGVRLQTSGQFVRVDISDNGPNIWANNRPIIMDKSDCLNNNDENEGNLKGVALTTNLALLISRDIICHFGGRLWVDEALTHGAKFSFTLPY